MPQVTRFGSGFGVRVKRVGVKNVIQKFAPVRFWNRLKLIFSAIRTRLETDDVSVDSLR